MSLGKLFFGIVLLLVGVIFILDTFGVIVDAWRLWPLIVIVAAIFIIIGAFIAPKPWYKTEEGWQNFANKMEKKYGDPEKWEKFGERMEKKFGDPEKWERVGKKMEREFEKEFDEDDQKKSGD